MSDIRDALEREVRHWIDAIPDNLPHQWRTESGIADLLTRLVAFVEERVRQEIADMFDDKPINVDVRTTGVTVFSVRLPVDEIETLRLAAQANGERISDLVRRRLRAEAVVQAKWDDYAHDMEREITALRATLAQAEARESDLPRSTAMPDDRQRGERWKET